MVTRRVLYRVKRTRGGYRVCRTYVASHHPLYAMCDLFVQHLHGPPLDVLDHVKAEMSGQWMTDVGCYALLTNGGAVCQYVGQSMRISNRIAYHAEMIEYARNGLEGPSMYETLARFEPEGVLYVKVPFNQCFVASCAQWDKVKRNRAYTTIDLATTVLEQFLMDYLKPQLNAAPARKTKWGGKNA